MANSASTSPEAAKKPGSLPVLEHLPEYKCMCSKEVVVAFKDQFRLYSFEVL
jgi:hypothetical protein